MGLQKKQSDLKYIRLKEGKFYLGKDLETPYDELEGTITNIRYKDEEFEGTPVRKLVLTIKDGVDVYQLGLNVESANYNTLISFLKGVDVTKTLTLHPKMDKVVKDGKETTRYSILVSQNGKYAKSYFSKDERHGMPDWKKVKVGNKIVIDKSESLEFLEKFVNQHFISKINEAVPVVVDETVEEEPVLETNVASTGLPWED